jgi:hypothetical protein
MRRIQPSPTSALTLELLNWVAERPRTYAETMAAWGTSCPRMSIWEDASSDGLVTVLADDGESNAARVRLTPLGRAASDRRPMTVSILNDYFDTLHTPRSWLIALGLTAISSARLPSRPSLRQVRRFVRPRPQESETMTFRAIRSRMVQSLALSSALRHSAPLPQPFVTRTRKRAARAAYLTHFVLQRSEVRLAWAPGWRLTPPEPIAVSQCASPLDSDRDATSPIASARTRAIDRASIFGWSSHAEIGC